MAKVNKIVRVGYVTDFLLEVGLCSNHVPIWRYFNDIFSYLSECSDHVT